MRRTFSTLVVVVASLALVAPGVAQAHRGHHHPLLHPVHVEGTFVYEDGSSRALVGDRGEITAIDDVSLTLTRPDDVLVTIARTDGTCVRLRGRESTWEDLTVGLRIAAISEPASAGGLAGLVIRAGTPLFRPDLPSCGLFVGAVHGDGTATFVDGTMNDYAWDRGRITGIAPRRIRILRADDVSVTAAVDRRTVVCGVRSYRALNLGEPVWMVSLKVHGDPEDLVARIIHRIRT
jgi:hypothetical protein